MVSVVTTHDDLRVGDLVRLHREKRWLSVRMLAGESGFSPSFISQVENGQTSPSVASLKRIAAALGLTLGEFFQDDGHQAPTVVLRDRRQNLTSSWSRARIEALGPTGAGHKLRPLLITFEPGGQSGKKPEAYFGEEFALVFAGEITLTLADEVHHLHQGDAVTIPPGMPHRWENTSSEAAQVVLVASRFSQTL